MIALRPQIFVDLDGVLADWFTAASKMLNNNFKDGSNDFDWEDLFNSNPNMYRELPLMPDAMLLWKHIEKYNPVILTAIPSRWHWPQATAQKRNWVHEHFGEHVDVRFGPFAIDKQFHCVHNQCLLIDDMEKNIVQWKAAGGPAIHHKSAAETVAILEMHGI